MIKNFQKFDFWLIALTLFYIPFYRFFQALLQTHTDLPEPVIFWLTHWYEPVLIGLLLINLAGAIYRKTLKIDFQLISLWFLLVFGIILILLHSNDLGRSLEGFRFTLFPLAAFMLIRFSGLSQKQQNNLIKIYLFTALAAAVLGIIEHFLPENYWGKWGIIDGSLYWYGVHKVGSFNQSVSFIGGANQLGSFLLPAFFFLLDPRIRQNFWAKAKLNIILPGVIAAAIILTLSRSSWVGLFAGFIFWLIIYYKNALVKKILFIAFGVAAVAAAVLSYTGPESIKLIISHGPSFLGHVELMTNTFHEIFHRFVSSQVSFWFGSGLGTAGPLVTKYGGGIVSESWYLQIVLEMGLAGLVLWLSFFTVSIKKLLHNSQPYLLTGFIAALANTAFLHTFSDNPALTFYLFAFLAFAIGKRDKASAAKD